jgi:dipeptidyl aminopeptidase/acylaminoacyl peptidase
MTLRFSLVATLTFAVIAADGVGARAGAQTPGLFTLDQILASPFPENLTASTTGGVLAWTVNERGLRNIYLAEAPDFKPRRLTNETDDDGRELTDLSFSDDARSLVYVRGGNRDASSPQVWSITIDGGIGKRIGDGVGPVIAPRNHRVAFLRDGRIWIAPIDGSTPAQSVYIRGTSEGLTWSPDGETLAFASNRDTHGFITLFTRAGQPVQYVAPSTSRDSAPAWSPDGSQLAFVRQPGGGSSGADANPKVDPWSIVVSDLHDGPAHEVWKGGSMPVDSLPDVVGGANLHWGGADRLVFLSYRDGWPHVYSLPAAGGSALLLTPGPFAVDRLTLSPDRRSIVYSANGGTDRDDLDRRHVFTVPVDAAQPTQLTKGRGIEWGPVITSDGRTLAYLSSTPFHGPLPTIQPLDGTRARALGDDRVASDFPLPEQLVAPESVTMRANDGVDVHGQLFTTGGGNRPRPALIFLHDGPAEQTLLAWPYSFDHRFAYAVNQYLASRGFLVLSLNYRSGVGYGHAYQHANLGAGPAGYDDILAAATYLRGRPDVDPKRVGIWGAAYGGYLTAVALARNSDVFAAGVDAGGSADLTIREIESLTMSVDDDCTVTVSPLHWTTPALLIHGDDDGTARFRQSERLDEMLRDKGAPIETDVITGDTPRHLAFADSKRVATSVAAYFERVLAIPPAR